MGGPVGRRSRWHQFLARFALQVVYIKEEDRAAADVLSRWAYPAYLANPDTNLHGSDADKAGGMHRIRKLRSGSTQRLQGQPLPSTPSCTIPPYHLAHGTTRMENG